METLISSWRQRKALRLDRTGRWPYRSFTLREKRCLHDSAVDYDRIQGLLLSNRSLEMDNGLGASHFSCAFVRIRGAAMSIFQTPAVVSARH